VKQLPKTRSCFCCGESNPLGFRFDLAQSGDVVETRFSFKPEYCGFPGVVHGGLITAALDELMAWAVGISAGRFAYAAEINVRFLQPVAPGVSVLGRGRLVENKRNRLFLPEAEILSDDGAVIHAASTGKFLPLPDAAERKLRSEFIGDADFLFERRSG
jgi:acyl-coenzyme A thioesterase PaaI-like protein